MPDQRFRLANKAVIATSAAVAPASLAAGEDARYTISMINNGPSVTSDARLSIDVPTGLAVSAVVAPFEPESGAYGSHGGHAHPQGHSSDGEGRGPRIHDHFASR